MRFGLREDAPFDPQAFIDADIQYLRAMSDGMDGMCHADDVRVAESLRDLELPGRRDAGDRRRGTARSTTPSCSWHRDAGHDVPDLNELDAQGINLTFFHGFPHFFVLPMYSSASVVPVPPVGAGGDADGDLVAGAVPGGRGAGEPTPPEVWECDDPRWPPIPAQDFSNLPRQQKGLHAKGFEYMRLSSGLEGHISNFERTIDGFLAGLPYEQLLPALAGGQRVSRSSSRCSTSASEKVHHPRALHAVGEGRFAVGNRAVANGIAHYLRPRPHRHEVRILGRRVEREDLARSLTRAQA